MNRIKVGSNFEEIQDQYMLDQQVLRYGSKERISEVAPRHALELKIGQEECDKLTSNTLTDLLKRKARKEVESNIFSRFPDRRVFERTLNFVKDNIKKGRLNAPQFSEETDKIGRASLIGDGGTYIRTFYLKDREKSDPASINRVDYSTLKEFIKIFPSRKSRKTTRQNEEDLRQIPTIKEDIAFPIHAKGNISSYFFLGEDAYDTLQHLNEEEKLDAQKEFEQKYVARYGESAGFVAAEAYDNFMILAKALESCVESDYDPDCLKEEILKVQNYIGASGIISFNREDYSVDKPIILKTVRNGEFVKL
jgi:hypothetical protein